MLSCSNQRLLCLVRAQSISFSMGLRDALKNALREKVTQILNDGAPPSSPPNREGQWRLMEQVSDEFNGTALDTNKWVPFNKTWKGRAPGWFNPENVVVADNCLQLHSKLQQPPETYPSDYKKYSTAFVRSKAQVCYGYFEARVEPADSCISSAWWFARNDAQSWNELDVFEVSTAHGHGKRFTTNAHVFRKDGKTLDCTLSHPLRCELEFCVGDGAFTAGFLWTKEWLEWSVEGKVVRRERNQHWHEEMWLQFDAETMPKWFGLPGDEHEHEHVPCCYRVHYIRAWELL